MRLTLKQKYGLVVVGISALFLLSILMMRALGRFDVDFRSDPTYPAYLRTRELLLRPGSIATVAGAFVLWSVLLYARSRIKKLTDNQKVLFLCMVLSAFCGYVFTACFKL